jgi:hypothetical protein
LEAETGRSQVPGHLSYIVRLCLKKKKKKVVKSLDLDKPVLEPLSITWELCTYGDHPHSYTE